MFKISRRQTILRASLLGCIVVAVLSTAAYFIINQQKDTNAAIHPGDHVSIGTKKNTYAHRYGSKRESGNDYDGSMTRWYTVKAPDKTVYDGFCAQASHDDPREKNKEAIEIPNNQKNGDRIKLMIYIWHTNNSNTSGLRNQIFGLMNKGYWSDGKPAFKRYLFAHAVISGLYDSDYYGLNTTEKEQVQQAASYLKDYINRNTSAWQEANNYTLYYAKDTDSEDQDVVWIDESPQVGTINVQKCDYDTRACTPQGDATFAGNLIQVYNASNRDIYDFIADTTYPNGALVTAGQLDGNGRITFDNLPADNVTYRIVEASTNATYTLTPPTEQTVTLSTGDQTETKYFYNTVKKGKITVHKKDADIDTEIDTDTNPCPNLYGLSFNHIKFELFLMNILYFYLCYFHNYYNILLLKNLILIEEISKKIKKYNL